MLFRNHHNHLITRILTFLLLLLSFFPTSQPAILLPANPTTPCSTLPTTLRSGSRPRTQSPVATVTLIADCVRLTCLPFESCGLLTVTPGRYLFLLHRYHQTGCTALEGFLQLQVLYL